MYTSEILEVQEVTCKLILASLSDEDITIASCFSIS